MRLSVALITLARAFAGIGPCDIFSSGGTPCVAAHSLVRALFGVFNGSLYQVKRLADNATRDIGVLTTGGFVDATAQDVFCVGSPCVVQRIYDQSPFGNHLDIAPPGEAHKSYDNPVNATRHPITASGHAAYAAFFEGGMGYRIDVTAGVAKGNDPETLYMVTSGTHVNAGCCFDYGNAGAPGEDSAAATPCALAPSIHTNTNRRNASESQRATTRLRVTAQWKQFTLALAKSGDVSVELRVTPPLTRLFIRCPISTPTSADGSGPGPWVMADLENGLWGTGCGRWGSFFPAHFRLLFGM